MRNQFDISVLVPVYNEQDSIKTLYSELKENLNHLYNWEVLFLNDGSTDKSKEIISELAKSKNNVNVAVTGAKSCVYKDENLSKALSSFFLLSAILVFLLFSFTSII